MAFEGTSVGAVWAQLKLDTAQFDSAMAGMSLKVMNVGANLTKFLTLPIVGVGVAAGKMYTDFELTMSRITGLVGLSTAEVNKMSAAVTQLAPAVGRAPQELADALFYITSAGVTDTAKAMDVLTNSAKAAAAGLGQTKVVADAVTSAVNAYQSTGLTAAKATDVLTAAVRYGKLEADALAPVMGRVIAVGSSMGISFDQVAGAIAAMSRVGFNASEAATSLTSIMATMLKPTSAATDALAKHGLSMAQLRDMAAQPGGLIEVLRLLNKTFDGNDDELAQVIPNVRALRGVMNLLSQDSATVDMVLQGVTNSVGETDRAFQSYKETNKALIDTALAGMKSSLIEIGGAVMPMVAGAIKELGKVITSFAAWWASLDEKQQKSIVTAAAVVAAIGPVITIVGVLMNPIGQVVAGIAAVTAGAIYLANNWQSIWTRMQSSGNPIIQGIVSMIETITATVRGIIKAIQDVIEWFKRMKQSYADTSKDVDIAFKGGVSGKVTTAGQIAGHATGGYFTTPHIAAIAEQEPEWVVPQSRAAEFAGQMGGGNNDSLLRSIGLKLDTLISTTRSVGPAVGAALNGAARR